MKTSSCLRLPLPGLLVLASLGLLATACSTTPGRASAGTTAGAAPAVTTMVHDFVADDDPDFDGLSYGPAGEGRGRLHRW